MLHPVYNDEEAVARLTREHVSAGRTVLQMFQLADSERDHSLRALELLQLEAGARVASLGCGVGGMERYWHDARPDLSFWLVNQSEAQLQQCVCPGIRVHADMRDYIPPGRQPFGCTVLAYVLGHVDVELMLARAVGLTKRKGVVLVLDLFDTTPQFDDTFHYSSPTSQQMQRLHYVEHAAPYPWRLIPLIHRDWPWVPRHATPGIWTRRV